MNRHKTSQLIARLVLAILGTILTAKALPPAAAAVTGSTGYTVSVFATAPPGLGNSDSITMVAGSIFVTYANNATATGSSGASTVVEFSPGGQVIRTFAIQGKNDGLKYNPYDQTLWAVRNEDGNPALTLIDPKTGLSRDLTFATPPVHGGGYDDVAFLNGKIYITASNPTLGTNGQNSFPSIVMGTIIGNQVQVSPVLLGDATLTDITSGAPAVSAQSDPDSLKVDPSGTLVMDSQADGDLIFVSNPGSPNQSAQLLHLSNGTTNQVTVDDTVFPTSPSGTILVVDTKGNTVYAVQSAAFQVAGAYSASDSDGALGKVDLSTGFFTPIVTGMGTPHGALFIPSLPDVTIALSLNPAHGEENPRVRFTVSRTGDLSNALVVNYNVNVDSKQNNDYQKPGSVTIPAGRSSADAQVALRRANGIESLLITVEPSAGYNVASPAVLRVPFREEEETH